LLGRINQYSKKSFFFNNWHQVSRSADPLLTPCLAHKKSSRPLHLNVEFSRGHVLHLNVHHAGDSQICQGTSYKSTSVRQKLEFEGKQFSLIFFVPVLLTNGAMSRYCFPMDIFERNLKVLSWSTYNPWLFVLRLSICFP
jgi:hypothetical protein